MTRLIVVRTTTRRGFGFRLGAVLGLLLLAGLASLVILGSLRYGSVEDLFLRVQMEFASSEPHPQWVPTPLPTPEGGNPLALTLIDPSEDESVASRTPRPGADQAALQFREAGSQIGSSPSSAQSTSASIAVQPGMALAAATSGELPSAVRSRGLDESALPLEIPCEKPGAFRSSLALEGSAAVDPGGAAAPLPSVPVQQPAATSTPAASPTPPPQPTATPTTEPVAPTDGQPSSVQLSGMAHFWQTWNNCGPATLAMNLSYYGSELKQADTAKVLKPDKQDKNVSPHEMVAFARTEGFQAIERVNGDFERLRRLVDAGVPVLIETWLEHDGGMGHYRLVVGWDDAAGEWIVYDSYVSEGVDPAKPYPGIRIPYEELDRLWRVFNRTYVLVYDEARAATVHEILGTDLDDAAMWQKALARAQADVQQNPQDAFAWFNLGSSLAALQRYQEAASAFDQARVIGLPWRMLWYQFGPFKAYHETGRYDELIALADATIATAGNIEETFFWRGRGLQANGDSAGARQAYQRAIELNSNYTDAVQALQELSAE